jgi:hypothetical protein
MISKVLNRHTRSGHLVAKHPIKGAKQNKFALRLRASLPFVPPLSEEIFCFLLIHYSRYLSFIQGKPKEATNL